MGLQGKYSGQKVGLTLKLVLLFLTCFFSSCNQHGKVASKELGVELGDTIKRLIEQLSKETEFHASQGIGYAGETTHQYILSDSLWHVATTERLAYLALSHSSPVVRLSASYGLMKRNPHLAAEVAIEGVLDTAMCEIFSGCISECNTVGADRIQKLVINRKWYGLSVEDSLRLDSVVLYKPYNDRYDRDLVLDLMERLPPHSRYYGRLKDLFQKEHCIYALMGIAKYQHAQDRQLMIDMAQKAICLSQKKYDNGQDVEEKDCEEEITLDELEEEADETLIACTPPQKPSESDAEEVSHVIIRSTSFWPDKDIVRAVEPLRNFYYYWFEQWLGDCTAVL